MATKQDGEPIETGKKEQSPPPAPSQGEGRLKVGDYLDGGGVARARVMSVTGGGKQIAVRLRDPKTMAWPAKPRVMTPGEFAALGLTPE